MNHDELKPADSADLMQEQTETEQPQETELPDQPADTPAEYTEEQNKRPKDKKKREDPLYVFLDYAKTVVIVVIIGILITQFIIQRNTVQGSSMVPTLHAGDELIVEKVSRYFDYINRGDIITADTHGLDPDDPTRVIKRVVGLPGEHVEIYDGKVFINGKELNEPYLSPEVRTDIHNVKYADVTLGPDEYYCMGDNRPGSKDSRNFGPVPHKNILGKVLVRVYPFDKFGNPAVAYLK